MRFNLDPLGKHSDYAIWQSLEAVQLKDRINSMQSGLETRMNANGSNFSVGERQLMCLARALLKKSKIVVIDEATANMDSKSDQLIQDTIRKQFAECTVLTIAHRLTTVADSHRIMCLSKGRVKDFRRPRELLEDERSVFSELCSKLSENEQFNILRLISE